MLRREAAALQVRQREVITELVTVLADRAPDALDPALRPDWLAAADDAARLRVVVDQVAGLTDLSAPAWHARLTTRGRRTRGPVRRSSGAGLAGAKAAETLRAEGFDGPVVLVGDEDELPYERPPLSKGYLLGKEPREKASVHPPEWYAEHDVDLRLGTAASALDPAEHEVELAGGERLRVRQAAAGHRLAWCARCRCPAPTAVRTLRRLPDADAIRAASRPAPGWSSSAPAGSGWRSRRPPATHGAEVTWWRSTPAAAPGPRRRDGDGLRRPAPRARVDLRFGSGVREIGGRRPRHARRARRRHEPCRPTSRVVGVGIRPDTSAGRGGRAGGRRRRRRRRAACAPPTRTSTPPATSPTSRHPAARPADPGRALGERAQRRPGRGEGDARPGRRYDRVPYFFSDQYDLGMEYSRLGRAAAAYDRWSFRGDLGRRGSSSRSGCPAAGCWPA